MWEEKKWRVYIQHVIITDKKKSQVAKSFSFISTTSFSFIAIINFKFHTGGHKKRKEKRNEEHKKKKNSTKKLVANKPESPRVH